MNKEDKYYNLAKEYAKKQNYPLVRFVCIDNELHIYNLTNPQIWGHKIGLPTFISIDKNEIVKNITERSIIMKYFSILTSVL